MTDVGHNDRDAQARARRPGPAGVRRLVVPAAFVLLSAVLGFGIYDAVHTTHSGLGPLPSWLPNRARHPSSDAILVGTAARPALTVEGDAIEVRTPHWSVLAVVSGPIVPGEGLAYQQRVTTCTWTVTFSHATGPVPIAVSDFASVDHTGVLYHPALLAGEAVPPPTLLPGHSLTFQVRAAETVGQGLIGWAPTGGLILAKWDYEIEND